MSKSVTLPSRPKKLFHHRNDSDELDVFQATRYFSGATENINHNHTNASDESRIFGNSTQSNCMRSIRRTSLDMPNHLSRDSNNIPSKGNMLMENPILLINKLEKKSTPSKQPSSPGGRLAHFLNSLFHQTSSSNKLKSKSKPKSTKDEDHENTSPSGWRRKRRSSMSHLMSGNTNSTTTINDINVMSDSKSRFSTSTNSGFTTPRSYNYIAQTPCTKTKGYRDPRSSYSSLKPLPTQITEIPINKIQTFNIKNDDKQEKHHQVDKYASRKDIKRFIDDDEGADSDSSSDLFELAICDLGKTYSGGLPVYETTHLDIIKRGAPISS